MPAIKNSPTTTSKTKPGVILFHGSDAPAVKKASLVRAEKLAPADTLNFETIDAQADNVEEALRRIEELRVAILTLPFFGGGKLVWWKNVNFLDDGIIGRSVQVKEALESLVPDLEKADGESVTVLISVLALHKGRTFSKALLKMAESTAFDLPDLRRDGLEECLGRIEEQCRAAGLQPGPGAAQRLYLAVGLDSALLGLEIEKLAAYLGEDDPALTVELVQKLVGGKVDVLIWDFCDAVLGSKSRPALTLLEQLLDQDETEIGILAMLAGQVRLAALAGMLREAGMLKFGYRGVDLTAEAQALLPRKKTGETINTYNLGLVATKSKHQPASHWFRALDRIYQAQRKMLSGTADKVRTLELVVLELTSGT